jgi:hypothetical protein
LTARFLQDQFETEQKLQDVIKISTTSPHKDLVTTFWPTFSYMMRNETCARHQRRALQKLLTIPRPERPKISIAPQRKRSGTHKTLKMFQPRYHNSHRATTRAIQQAQNHMTVA